MNTLCYTSIGILVIGVFTITTAFNNATRWRMETACNVSRVGVILVLIGLVLLVITGGLKAAGNL